ncbi:MAG: hypothetical protein HOV78_11480 [Hamadaea sp.]|nr:hypothetical protein [Hamadaea sp.]
MSGQHLGLTAARLHALPVARPGSEVFHLYVGPLTPTGRYVPRTARSVCSARTRRLTVIQRAGSALDLGGRRVCGRCSARLSAESRRAEQPTNRDAAAEFHVGITLGDLVLAIAMATSTAETHRIGFAMGLRFPPAPTKRPKEIASDRDALHAALFDTNAELLRTRDRLRMAERTPEQVAADELRRETEDDLRARAAAGRRKSAAMDRAIDRRNRGSYLMPHERELLNSA